MTVNPFDDELLTLVEATVDDEAELTEEALDEDVEDDAVEVSSLEAMERVDDSFVVSLKKEDDEKLSERTRLLLMLEPLDEVEDDTESNGVRSHDAISNATPTAKSFTFHLITGFMVGYFIRIQYDECRIYRSRNTLKKWWC